MQSVEKDAMKLWEKLSGAPASNERAKALQTDLEDWGNMEPIFLYQNTHNNVSLKPSP